MRLEARPPSVEGRGEVTIRHLVRNALRMRPDRIVVGEVRGGEALDMLAAMTTGHDGSLSTVHAGSPEEALRRLETLALMAGVGLPHAAIREQVADALDLVVHQARLPDGTRRVVAVAEVVRVAGGPATRELFGWRAGRPRWRAALSDEPGRSASAAGGGGVMPSRVAARRSSCRGCAGAWRGRGVGGAGGRSSRRRPRASSGAGSSRWAPCAARAARRRRPSAGGWRSSAPARCWPAAGWWPVPSRARPAPRAGRSGSGGSSALGASAGGPSSRAPRPPRRGRWPTRSPAATRSAARSAVAAEGGVPGAAGAELRAAARALALGARTEDVLERMRARAGAPAWDTIVAAILLQRDAGGDLAGLLRSIAGGLEDAARVEADARSATAQARFTAWLVALLPVGAAVLAELADPGYVVTLLRAPLAPWLLGAAGVCQLIGMRAHQPHRARAGGVMTRGLLARRPRRRLCGRWDRRARGGGRRGAGAAERVAAAAVPGYPRRWRAWAGASVRRRRRATSRAGSRRPARRRRSTVAEVMALKCGAAVAAFAAALPAAALLPGRLGPAAIAAAPAGAFVAPDAWLARATRRRRAAMAAELPDVLDLLHVAVRAGLPALRALGEVGRRRAGSLAAELRAAAASAALGVPHAQALDRLARRCPLEGVAALVAAIGRCERHGAPLAPALHALAADARAQRAQRVREARRTRGAQDPARRRPAARAGRDAPGGRVPVGRGAGRMTREPTRQVCTIAAP